MLKSYVAYSCHRRVVSYPYRFLQCLASVDTKVGHVIEIITTATATATTTTTTITVNITVER